MSRGTGLLHRNDPAVERKPRVGIEVLASPFAVALALWVWAFLERGFLAWTGNITWIWSAFSLAVHSGPAVVAFLFGRSRSKRLAYLLSGPMAFAAGWTWVFIGLGNSAEIHFVYFMVSIGAGIAIDIYLTTKGDAGGHDRLRHHRGALAQASLSRSQVLDNGQVVTEFVMEDELNAKELVKEAATLDAAMRVRPGTHQILPSADDAAAGTIVATPVNNLKESPVWVPPIGRTAADPVVLGVRQTGDPAQFWLQANPRKGRAAPLVQVVGMSGAGKTVFLEVLFVELIARPDVRYWYGDASKGGQVSKWILENAARTAGCTPGTNVGARRKEVMKMISDFKDAVVERADALGAHGCKVWSTECCWAKHRIPLLVMVIDEAAEVASSLESVLTRMSETVRSVGQVPVLCFQRATGDRLPTSARANFNSHFCFGVLNEADAIHGGLPEDLLELIGDGGPWLWKAKEPGMAYMSVPGVPDDLCAQPARTFTTLDRDADILEAVRHFEARRLDAMVATAPPPAAAPPVAARPREVELFDQEKNDQPTTTREPDPDGPDVEADMKQAWEESRHDPEVQEAEQELRDAAHPDDRDEIERDEEGEYVDMTEVDDAPLAYREAGARQNSARAHAVFYTYLLGLRDEGVTEFVMAAHVERVAELTSMKRSWMANALARFSDDPKEHDPRFGPALLTKPSYGKYEFLPRAAA